MSSLASGLTYREKLALLLGGPGSGNFGHAGRPGERGGSATADGGDGADSDVVRVSAREFQGDSGYEWHEEPERTSWAVNLPEADIDAIGNYASFGYVAINEQMRGIGHPRRTADDVVKLEAQAAKINESIRERGYVLPEAIAVNRAAYIPDYHPKLSRPARARSWKKKGFTSTMAGNPDGRRLDSYVMHARTESIYARTGGKQIDQDEVGTAMRVKIVLPAGTKVALVEPARRIRLEHPVDARGFVTDYNIVTARTVDRSEDSRREAEVLLGSGAKFRVVSVKQGKEYPASPDGSMRAIPVQDVVLEYVGGGSSEDIFDDKKLTYRERLAILLGGKGSGNFGHAGRPGERGGSASEGEGGDTNEDGSPRSPLEAKRHAFIKLIKEGDEDGDRLEASRTEMNDAWKKWAEDTKNRKKPLKPDGAAAKKLDSYKEAKSLEEAFHAQYAETQARDQARNAAAREMLKVPPENRSELSMEDDPKHPIHPAISAGAKRALETLRQFDGSGAFEPLKMPLERIEQFKAVFGDDGPPLKVNEKDGTFHIPATIKVSKSETDRAHASIGAIHLAGGRELERVVFHEVAHHIEMKSPQILQAAIEFRESMATKPREVYKLNTVLPALGDEEVALRGNFKDHYSGKIYPGDLATEIVSTGVESYMLDPVRFARERPEHFNFIFDVMHGKYRNKP